MNRYLGLLAFAAVFLSGVDSLTYEILWQRQMILAFGASAPATTAILTALFLGIAFGSRLEEKLQPWIVSPALMLAAIEFTIGLWAFLVPVFLSWSDTAYVAAARMLGEGSFWLPHIRFGLAILTVLPATLGMGATIPVIVRLFSGPGRNHPVAWAYGINIAGAVLGCLLAGFVLVRMLGLSQTRLTGVGVSAVVVLLMVGLHFFSRGNYGQRLQPHEPRFRITREHRVTGGLYFLAGFIALGLEIVWLRFLGIVNSSSATTFTLALAIYLAGMGLGTLVLYPLLARTRLRARTIFSISNLGTAVSALLTYPILFFAVGFNERFLMQPARRGDLAVSDIVQSEILISTGLMLLPTIFMGLAFPAVCDTLAPDSPGRRRLVGYWYFLGTLGSAAGILAVSLLLIPALGLQGGFACLVALGAVLFVAVLWQDRPLATLKSHTALALAVIAGAAWMAHDPRPVLKQSVARKVNGEWHEFSPATGRSLSRILRYEAGPSATVIIKEVNRPDARGTYQDSRQVYIDDQLVASTDLAAKTDAVMLAHLPLLLHPAPKQALTVGFGSGGTSHSMTAHGIRTHAVEIEPEVPRSAHLLEDQNFGVLNHPLFRLIINDARDHLRAGTSTYDVISTDVTNLEYKQNSNLYTVEYFRLMREKLNPGGIACAWIPMTAIGEKDFKTLLASFLDAFPHATLWFVNHTPTNFGILIGTEDPLEMDYGRFQDAFQRASVREDLERIGITDPLQIAHFLHLDTDGLHTYAGDADRHTDNHPILEFTSLYNVFAPRETFRTNLTNTLALSPEDRLPFVTNLPPDRVEDFRRHGVASRAFAEALAGYYEALIKAGEQDRAGVVETLREAVAWAETGRDALSHDPERHAFYRDILKRWLERELLRSAGSADPNRNESSEPD